MNYRPGLPPLPARMRGLPLSPKGYPVPYFVSQIDGHYNFQLADAAKYLLCVRRDLCWICGQPLGVFRTFVVGPMAAMNRISAEPPSHADCAEYAVQACPFMLLPKAQRRKGEPALPRIELGLMLPANPGVSLLWTTKQRTIALRGRIELLLLGEPTLVRWIAEGRPATRKQALLAVADGLLQVSAHCASDAERADLDERSARLHKLLPREDLP